MNRRKITHFLLWVSACTWLTSVSADDQEGVPEPPEIPPALESGEALEPEVTIIKRKEGVISEYRINGHLYMVKVQPAVGPAYYLHDRDGDGELDARSNDPDAVSVPQWILFRW
jgi:hypothetical protein